MKDNPLKGLFLKQENSVRKLLGERQYISTRIFAAQIGVTPERARKLLRDGRVDGAMKPLGTETWIIPEDYKLIKKKVGRPGDDLSKNAFEWHLNKKGVPGTRRRTVTTTHYGTWMRENEPGRFVWLHKKWVNTRSNIRKYRLEQYYKNKAGEK